jgi:hypothetical protein
VVEALSLRTAAYSVKERATGWFLCGLANTDEHVVPPRSVTERGTQTMKLVERERRRAVLTNRPETRPEQSSRPEPSIRMQPRPDIRDAIEATRRLPERSCPPRRLTRPAWPVAIDRDRRASTPERLPSKPARRSGRASCSSRGLSLFASVASSCLPVHDRFVANAIASAERPGRSHPVESDRATLPAALLRSRD